MPATMYDTDPRVDTLLQRLCDYFDAELDRQGDVLAICRAHGEATRALDLDVLDKRTEALALTLSEAAEAERERLEIVEELVKRLAGEPEEWTLSTLIANVPQPWRRRLAERQLRIRETVSESQKTIAANSVTMRRSLRTVNGAIDSVLGPATAAGYTNTGGAPETQTRRAAVLNAQG